MLDSIQPRQHDTNFEPTSELPAPPKKRRKSRFRLWLGLIMLTLLGIGILVGSKLVIVAQKVLEGRGGPITFRNLFIAPDKPLIGEEEGEVRILLLGIGGEAHEGGTLTDTMILATLKVPKSKNEKTQVALVSIPRDLLVNIPGYDFRKINSAHAFGELNDQKQGPSLTLRTLQDVLGMSIPYYAVVDFQGFKKTIDDLGGVEINVETGFTDALYPDEKDGYLPPVTFTPGLQVMNGARALQFVRSRHGDNNQGSDFARSKRQQQVLNAVKEKTTSLKVLTNLGLINKILNDLANHVRTNFEPYELKRLYNLTKGLEDKNLYSLTLDLESGLVCSQILEENGAYVLIPCAGLGKYDAIREFVRNQFLFSSFQKEKSTIEIQNSTTILSLGSRTQGFLRQPFLKISTGNFHGQTGYSETTIYDNTRGQKPETLKYLVGKLGSRVAASPYPFQTATEKPDFVIIVSQDLDSKLP